MTLRQFFRILWARKWSVLGMALFGLAVAITLSYVLPPRYTASTDIIIDFKGIDPVSGVALPAQMLPGYMSTQFDIIRSHNVALKVVRRLKLTEIPAIRQDFLGSTAGRGTIEDWLAYLIVTNLEIRPTRESSVVSLQYTSQDARFSALMADAFAQAYIDTNLELTVAPARDTATWFEEQIKQLRDNLSQAQAKLSAYQREKGYSAADERLDVETARLSELSAQYTITQAAAADALSRQRQLNEFLGRGATLESVPDVLGNPLIQNLKSQLAASQARLEQAASQLGVNHPEMQRLKADIAEQRQQLSDEIGRVSAAVNNALQIAQRREAELRNAVAQQKARMLALNAGRDELAVLVRELENAQRAMDAANSRLTQENLQSRISQTNVMVLSNAVPPLFPSFPKLMLNVPLGLLAGIFLGINLALVREYLDRKIRALDDLSELEGVPILGRLMHSSRPSDGRARWPRLRETRLRLPSPWAKTT